LKNTGFNLRINNQIRTKELRVIGPDGKQIGVMKLEKALRTSKSRGLDLIEIAPKAKPPVAKITDLGKFKYQREKKLKKQKKGTKGGDIKEIRFSPFIAEGDYQTRLERVNEFLNDGNKIRIVVKFKGRQMGSKPFGYKLIKKLMEDIKDDVNVDMEPKFIGRHLTTVISPTSGIRKKESKNGKTKNKKNTN
jgi:translation initiation factor IF-3